jgi:apoptosis-inducing factor 2
MSLPRPKLATFDITSIHLHQFFRLSNTKRTFRVATMSSSSSNKKVLVIGGGIAGLAACVALRKKDQSVEILLVEPKHFFQVPWAIQRALFHSKTRDASIFDLKPWCMKHNVTHLATAVTNLSETSATLDNGQVIDDFTVAIVCVGAVCKWQSLGRYPVIPPPLKNETKRLKGPQPKGHVLTREERVQQLEQDGQRLLDAGSVLVVGGGLIGVETAGDLAYFAAAEGKTLEVTLVHSGQTLIPEFAERASHMVHKKLTKLGVKVILNDRVVPSKIKNRNNAESSSSSSSSPTTKFHLQNGNLDVFAHHVVWTTGITAQNHAFLDSQYLTKKGGWIKVDETFQVVNSTKLFAFGDCCNLLPNAGIQVLGAMPVIGHNLKVALDSINVDGAAPTKRKRLQKALVQPEMYIASIGKKDGVALTPLGATGVGLPKLKNKTQFLMKPKSALGLK